MRLDVQKKYELSAHAMIQEQWENHYDMEIEISFDLIREVAEWCGNNQQA